MDRIRWGILGTANIARRSVIPAMQKGRYSEVVALASRDAQKAADFASGMGIPRSFGSYEELLNSPDIDAVYIPLPNHMHVQWSIAAMKAGKHVLCEKPVSLDVRGVKRMIAARDAAGVKIGEAFMVRSHPQWLATREIVRSGNLGKIVSVTGHFSYFNVDAGNIRNKADIGGGAIWDIGCYPVNTSRFVLGEEPERAVSCVDFDPGFGTDILTSAILDYPSCQAVFTVGTQEVPHQRMTFFGTQKRLEVEIPFNAPYDRPCRLLVWGGGIGSGPEEVREFPVCDQYTLQGDAFSLAILENTGVPVPLEDSLKNTAVLAALFESARTGKWRKIRKGMI